VLEHFFDGELRSSWDASANQVRELKERLVEWFDAWSAPDPVAHEVRLYLDTDFNAGVLPVDLAALSVSYQQPDLETFRERDRPTFRKLRRRYTGALLYSDRVIAIDPLAFWVQQEVLQTDLTMARAAIYMHWEALRRVEPLLRSGCLLLAPFPCTGRTPHAYRAELSLTARKPAARDVLRTRRADGRANQSDTVRLSMARREGADRCRSLAPGREADRSPRGARAGSRRAADN
jgi:hypothetical protein